MQNVKTPLIGGENTVLQQSNYKGFKYNVRTYALLRGQKYTQCLQKPAHVAPAICAPPRRVDAHPKVVIPKDPFVWRFKDERCRSQLGDLQSKRANESDRSQALVSNLNLRLQDFNLKKQTLLDQLKSISNPKNEYQIEIP